VLASHIQIVPCEHSVAFGVPCGPLDIFWTLELVEENWLDWERWFRWGGEGPDVDHAIVAAGQGESPIEIEANGSDCVAMAGELDAILDTFAILVIWIGRGGDEIAPLRGDDKLPEEGSVIPPAREHEAWASGVQGGAIDTILVKVEAC
jgi:hypothetical protein